MVRLVSEMTVVMLCFWLGVDLSQMICGLSISPCFRSIDTQESAAYGTARTSIELVQERTGSHATFIDLLSVCMQILLREKIY
jgi:hypothetical protein